MEKKAIKITKNAKKMPKKSSEMPLNRVPETSPAWAVVNFSGTQFKVTEGEELTVDRLGTEIGQTFEISEVYLIADGLELKIGQPKIAGAKVIFEVLKDDRGKKINVFKFKAKARFRKRHGHRSDLSRVKVRSVVGG